MDIICYEFNKSGNLLAVLCKTGDKIPEFSIKVLDMSTSEIGTATENIKGEKGVPYFTYLMSWVDATIVVAGKFRENNIETMNIKFFRIKKESTYFRLEALYSEKNIKNYRASHMFPSSNGIHFLLANMDSKLIINNI